jgi:MscS family membrane protein
VLQLKEILDRIKLPSFDEIPDREAMTRSSAKRWRLPDTEIDVVLIEDGPRAGEYLVSADTVDRLPQAPQKAALQAQLGKAAGRYIPNNKFRPCV